MARFIFPVGGTAESVRAQIGAVGPAPDPTTSTPPGVGDVLTWDGSAWVPGAGGGGGGTVIADGGTLSGTYTNDVLCLGDVSLAGNVTIKGKLIIENNLTNPDGYELTVLGDLFGRYFDLTRSDTSQVGGNVSVDGDFWFYAIDFYQTGGSAATLRVGGDLIGSAGFSGSYIEGYGLDDSPGLTIYVYGDLNTSYVDVYGGDSSLANAGNGGTVVVWGDLTLVDDINFRGGDSYSTGFSAGNGGYIEVYGNMTVRDVYGYGGYGDDASAGNGGDIDVGGSLVMDECELYGGECSSDNESHISGQGGSIDVNGNCVTDSYTNLNGGDRYGNLSAPASNASPNAGNFHIQGSLSKDGDLDAQGGGLYQSNFSVGQAGNGGYVTVFGSASFDDEVDLDGGYASIGDGGNGGELDARGSLTIEDDFDADGGYADNGNGGNGGTLTAIGFAAIYDVSLDGGYSNSNGNGGSPGYINIDGDFTCQSSIDLNGGGCNSANETHVSRNGGSLYVDGDLIVDGYVYLEGGDRGGNTTVGANNASPNGGYLSVEGNVNVDGINLSGGDVYTNFPNGAGGQSGNAVIDGDLRCGQLYLDGGDGAGSDGGQGGDLTVRGAAKFNNLYARGGNANDSVGVGGDAGTNGSAPDYLNFYAGLVADTIYFQDGAGVGAAPTNGADLYLGHHCTIGLLDATDRADLRIRDITASGNLTYLNCVLKIASMPTKQTLNNADTSATSNISGLLRDSIFISGPTTLIPPFTNWSVITGSAI